MNRLLRQLVKVGAVTVNPDGVLVPTHNRVKQSAPVYHDQQLLLADHDGTKLFTTASAPDFFGDLLPGVARSRGARVVRVESDKTGSASGIAERAPQFNSEGARV